MSLLQYIPVIEKVIDKVFDFIPNPQERERKKLEMLQELQKADIDSDKDQRDINKVEAAHPSLFVAGWRPFIGWVCGLAFAWLVLISPFLNFFVVLAGGTAIVIAVDSTLIVSTLGALLGVASLRSWDKYVGSDTKRTAPILKPKPK